MGAVGMLARSDIRRRWRSSVAVALLVGVVGAIVLATAAGARRSDSALGRFNAASRSADVEISVGNPTAKRLAEFRKTRGVAAMARLRGYALSPRALPDLAIAAPIDGAMGNVVDRSRLIAGRRADPAAPDEITISEGFADQLHLRLGGRLDVPSFSPAQIVAAFKGERVTRPAGPRVRLRIVGIIRRPLDLGVRAAAGGVVILTPAFHRKYEHRIGAYTDVLRVRTSARQADVPRVVAAARRLFGREQTFGAQPLSIETEGARNAIDVLTFALWVIAGVSALAGLVAIGIVLTRDIAQAGLDHPTLAALGLTRAQRVLVSGPRVLLIAGGGALLAGLGVICASPLFPIGVARRADPDPGVHADWAILAVGILLVVAVVLAIALLAAMRTSRRSSFEAAPHAYRRRSTIAELAAGAGLRPTTTNGLRMAIQSGSGESAVPVRSAFVGAVFGVAGVTAALVFAASLGHLVATPRLYGWTWDVKGEVGVDRPCADRRDHGLAREAGVEAVAVVCFKDIQLDGRPVTVWGFGSLHGTIDPSVVSGRAPRGPREVALGSVTLDALHKRIGDTVQARGPKTTRVYVIVGQIVLPTLGTAPQSLADGAAVTSSGFRPLYRAGGNETHFLVARVKPGGDRAAIERHIADIPARNVGGPTIPVEVARLQQIDRIPVYLAALLGTLALLAVAHALVTAVRRRRRELALFKVFGFDRRQVRATVAWQATTLRAVGLVIGIPIGVVVGRLAWQLVADGLGVSADVVTPTLWLVLSVPCALALVNLIAFFPARAAARTRPATALRSG